MEFFVQNLAPIMFVGLIFFLLLIARLVFDYVFMFARSWRPGRPLVFLLELIYSVTDPPLKALRRVIPPVRIGQISLDVAFMILMITVIIGMNLALAVAAAAAG